MISPEKKNKSVTEYLLYLWHMEDLIRSLNFEFEAINSRVIAGMPGSEEEKDKVRTWFKHMIEEMRSNRVLEKGHVEEAEEILAELFYLHNLLLNALQDKAYIKSFEKAGPNITGLQAKSTSNSINPIEICLTGVYGVLLLKIQSKGITKETEEAVKSFTELLNLLSDRYKLMKEGKLDFSQEIKN